MLYRFPTTLSIYEQNAVNQEYSNNKTIYDEIYLRKYYKDLDKRYLLRFRSITVPLKAKWNVKVVISEVAFHRFFHEKVLWKYAVNLQQNTHAVAL